MSTIKADAITAVSAGGDLSLDGLGTGGVSIASTLKMTKGGDIASASPLVIDTDGNYFDVTGTTNFSVMTVEAGNFFMLQFDGALTITHGSGIELPGAANLTTATGDRLICYATAANTVEVMSVETEAAAGGGGAWNLIGTVVASDDATLTITGLDSTYDVYCIVGSELRPAVDNIEGWLRLGDSGGVDAGSSDYGEWATGKLQSNSTVAVLATYGEPQIYLTGRGNENVGSAADEGMGFIAYLFNPGDTSMKNIVKFDATYIPSTGGGNVGGFSGYAHRITSITTDRVQFLFESGNVTSGRLSIWGVSHD